MLQKYEKKIHTYIQTAVKVNRFNNLKHFHIAVIQEKDVSLHPTTIN